MLPLATTAVAIAGLVGCGDSQADRETEDAGAIAVLDEVMEQARAICEVELVDGLITSRYQAGPNCERDVTVSDLDLDSVQASILHKDVDISTLRIRRVPGNTSIDGLKFTVTAPSGRRCVGSAAVPIECRTASDNASESATSSASVPTTPAPTPTTTDEPADPPSEQLAFTMTVESRDGDSAELTARVTDPVPVAESDAPPETLASCKANDRALIVRLSIAAKLTSSMPATLRIYNFNKLTTFGDARLLTWVMEYDDGPVCMGHPSTDDGVAFALSPDEPSGSLTAWVVMPDVITPNDPEPSAETIGHWVIDVPGVRFNDQWVQPEVQVSGPRYLCPRGFDIAGDPPESQAC